MRLKAFAVALVATFATGAAVMATESLPGAKVYFINLKNGDHLKSPVLIQFGLSAMGIAPAGSTNPGTGHHHLIVDGASAMPGIPIPMDMAHMHFGRGQTEVSVPLPAGNHVLELALADGGHVLHTPPVVSDKVTITVDP